MRCSPTELYQRLTNLDEVIILSALGERYKREKEEIEKQSRRR